MALTTLHLLMKGEDMAVSKNNRASGCETNPFFLELFREHGESDERERHWHTAMAHAGEGDPPLRFPAPTNASTGSMSARRSSLIFWMRHPEDSGWNAKPWPITIR